MTPPSIPEFVFSVIVLVALMFALRALVMWITGVGKMISLLESINRKIPGSGDTSELEKPASGLPKSIQALYRRFVPKKDA